jgi:NAD(P)-dependent dehydrogenase (short-subunit alcohol dehydrogenase family)
MTLSGERVLMIGGASGFGAAQAALEASASVVVASRSAGLAGDARQATFGGGRAIA